MPVTFAEGIPLRCSRPGPALQPWLRWLPDGFPQAGLLTMLRDGLLGVPDENGHACSFSRLPGWLRAVPIGFGQERYLPMLDQQLAAPSPAWRTIVMTSRTGQNRLPGWCAGRPCSPSARWTVRVADLACLILTTGDIRQRLSVGFLEATALLSGLLQVRLFPKADALSS
jgi:hypothetical protein